MPISVPKIWIWARLASPNSNIRHQYGPNTLLGRGKKSKGTPTLIKFFLCKQKNWGLNSCKYRHIVHLDTYLELERKIATSTTYDLPCIVIWEKTFRKFVSAESRNQSVQMMSPPYLCNFTSKGTHSRSKRRLCMQMDFRRVPFQYVVHRFLKKVQFWEVSLFA